MCGIAGIIGKGADTDEAAMARMLHAMQHRGPDDQGTASFMGENSMSVSLGHKRLSILDLSKDGHQPMYDNDDSTCIVFNGEIYNYIELKDELSTSYKFRTYSDTEVLLACYQKYGVDMLHKLDGMYAFALYDQKQNKVFTARDPIGIKPFYYSLYNGNFWFASEPTAILAGQQRKGVYDSEMLPTFLLIGITDSDHRTTLSNIYQLKGGHFIYQSLDAYIQGIEQRAFWKEPQVIDCTLEDAKNSYKEVLNLSVMRQLRSDVRLGSSLSGGIDSGAIVLTAGAISKGYRQRYSTLTFTSPYFPNDEAMYAERVARQVDFSWFPVEPDQATMSDDLEKMIKVMGEPFSTLSMFAQYKVMEKAHALGIKVMLDGQGGDEVNLGYPRVAQMVMWEHLKQGNLTNFYREWTGFAQNASVPLWKSIAYYLYFNSGRLGKAKKFNMLSRWIDNSYLDQYDHELLEDFFEPCSVYERQNKELRKYILPRLLRFADRNSMAFSVESRVPHLAQPMLDFALSMPYQHRVHNGFTKYLERSALQGKMPDDILWNPVKKGFDIPQAIWVKKLKPSIFNWLDNLPGQSPFKVESIRNDFEQMVGSHYYWRVISSIALVSINDYQL